MKIKQILVFSLIFSIVSCQGQEKKLLPAEIEMGRANLYYTYDEQNRFTSIKILMENKLYDYDSLVYKDNDVMLYNIDGSLRATVKIDRKDKYKYSYKYFIGDETALMYITFNPQYKISKLEYKNDEKDNNPVIYELEYDRNSNIKDVIIPDNINWEESPFQTFMFYRLYYDKKNGIFKHIDPITSPIITLQDNTFPYLLYMGGNKIDAIVKNSDRESDLVGGIYNEYDYPTKLGFIKVKKYIEVE